MTRKNFLAIDIGASSGRIFVGRLDQFNLKLEEAHRFSHSIQIINGTKRWNWKQILSEIFTGLNTACNITGNEKIESVCCDSWSQDFGLLDSQGELFYEPVSYRDKRTEGLPFGFSDVIEPLNLLKRNGSAVSPITTLCQLYSMTIKEPEIIRKADKVLFIADLVNYLLCGKVQTDLTFASASQMHNVKSGDWDTILLDKLGIPVRILPPIIGKPGIIGCITSSEIHPKLHGVPVITGSGHDTSLASSAIFPMGKGTLFMSLGTWAMLGCCFGNSIETGSIKDTSVSVMRLAWGKWALFGKSGVGMWLLEECMRKWKLQGIVESYGDLSDRAASSGIRSIINVNDKRFFAPDDMPSEIRKACAESDQELPGNPEDFVKVIIDSMVLGFRESIQELRQITGIEFTGLSIVGGGCRNKYLCCRITEVLDLPVTFGPPEATVAGNIILQARVLGILKNDEDACEVMKLSSLVNAF
jgi:rhamnulokinase